MPHWAERNGILSKMKTELTRSEVLNVSHRKIYTIMIRDKQLEGLFIGKQCKYLELD